MTFRRWSNWFTTAAACCCLASSGWCGDGGAARWATCQPEGSGKLYALSVQAAAQPKRRSVQVAVVVDTSASQTGAIRRESLEILDSLLATLPDTSKIALFACDVTTVDLSGGLQAIKSSAIEHARVGLSQRVPLGTTNIGLALEKAQKSFGDQSDGVIVYIGDGVNRTNILDSGRFESIVRQLVGKRSSLISIAIGPFYDTALLATLANHTGGAIFIRDNITASSQEIGMQLAKSVEAPVLWPEAIELPSEFSNQFPNQFPPVRSDRDSIVIGEMKDGGSEGKLVVRGTVDGKPSEMTWALKAEPENPDFGFLGLVLQDAKKNGGLMMPTPGSDALRELGAMLTHSAADLVRSGRMALQSGDLKAAADIANEALRRDPNSVDASSLRDAIRQRKDQSSVRVQSPYRLVSFGGQPPQGDVFGSAAPAQIPVQGLAVPATDVFVPNAPISQGIDELSTAGDLLAAEEEMRRVDAQRIEAEVQNDLRETRSLVQRDPAAAIARLKSRQSEVRLAPGLDAGKRNQLLSLLASGLQTAARRDAEIKATTAQAERAQAAANAASRLIADQDRRDSSVQQLVQRFNALMEQHQFHEANTDVAPLVHELMRGTVIDRSTEQNSAFASNYELAQDVIDRRRRAVVDSLYLNEAAAIPFVDDPPVVYPPPEAWKALTARRERFRSIDLAQTNSRSEQLIYESLKRKVPVSHNGTQLKQVISGYAEELGIPIFIDETALSDAGKSPEDPVTLNLPDVSFRSALKIILEPLELTYVIKDEVMKITTKDAAKAAVMKVYPVGDLVVPVMSGGGMMGGMMGGMGGMGMGGMGGMGMGGMGMGGMGGMGMGGMGMGGMGMGGMGGGMGGMFAVSDDARKATASSANTLQSAKDLLTAMDTASKEEAPALEQKLLGVVSDVFKLAKTDAAAKRMDSSRVHFQTIIDIISEALRSGHPQPWMYEAMSLSMQACDYPSEDIRRVLLSAVDFSGSAADSLKIAKHLESKGMKKEALQLLEDVSRVAPMAAAPYEMGLPLALELDDLDGIRWTCLGILKNGWPEEKADLVEKAQLAAKAAYMKLAKSKRIMEADLFEKDVKQAMKRDLVVRVTWTGNADIDLAVEEPSGSVCNINNPRTVGGGLLTGDGSSAVKSKDGTYSETYVCPQGFAGKYRALIQRAWGDVSGKVTVDVLSDYGTPEERYVRQQIDLGGKDALVELEVKTGHRDTPVVAAQIEKAELKRIEAARSVLAQESTGGTSGSRTGMTFNEFWMRQQQALLAANNRAFPFGGGAVGYRPDIQTISEGGSMTTTAVISGDRRYVRITPFPFFSQIIQVDTFNFVNGTGTTQPGGLGGGAGGAGGGFGGGGFGGGGIQ